MSKAAHRLVASTARDMAEALYEEWASEDNDFYQQMKGKRLRALFVAKVAPTLFEEARQALAQMLVGDYPQRTKDLVYEALILDNELRAHRPVAANIAIVPPQFH